MTHITVVGNIGSEPELKFTPSGTAVCTFSIADQARRKNAEGVWEDGDTTWYRVNVWNEFAENVAESLNKGNRVIVHGAVVNRKWTGSDGSEGQSLEIRADSVGPDLKWAQARVRKVERQQSGGQYQSGAPQDDPWGQAPNYPNQGQQNRQQQRGGGGQTRQRPQGGFAEEPPFLHHTPAFIA